MPLLFFNEDFMQIIHKTVVAWIHKNLKYITIDITTSNGITNYVQKDFSSLNPLLFHFKAWP